MEKRLKKTGPTLKNPQKRNPLRKKVAGKRLKRLFRNDERVKKVVEKKILMKKIAQLQNKKINAK